MYRNKRDKTRKQIINAFMELVSKYGLKEVTVKQVAELAGISRGTFYQHYYDKYAIFDDQKRRFFKKSLLNKMCF